MSREKRSFAQEVCVKSAGKAMQKTGMLWPGCRVAVAVSGGVDSFVLLQSLKIRQGIVPFHFEIMLIRQKLSAKTNWRHCATQRKSRADNC